MRFKCLGGRNLGFHTLWDGRGFKQGRRIHGVILPSHASSGKDNVKSTRLTQASSVYPAVDKACCVLYATVFQGEN